MDKATNDVISFRITCAEGLSSRASRARQASRWIELIPKATDPVFLTSNHRERLGFGSGQKGVRS